MIRTNAQLRQANDQGGGRRQELNVLLPEILNNAALNSNNLVDLYTFGIFSEIMVPVKHHLRI